MRYYIELDASEELDLGRYEYGFIIEMADYTSQLTDPDNGYAGVTSEILHRA